MPTGHRQPHGPRTVLPRQLHGGHCAGALLPPIQQFASQAGGVSAPTGGRVAAVAQHLDAKGVGALGERGGTRVVDADHHDAAGLEPLHEGVEHRHIGLFGAEEVQMVGFDVGDHHDVGAVLDQRSVALVRLGHEKRAAAVVGIGARLAQVAAHGEGRIEPGVLQRHDEHGRGGRLTRGAGHHQRRLSGHQLGQHLGAQDHRDPALACLDQFRIGLRNGRVGGHHRGRTSRKQVQRGRVVPDPDRRTTGPQRDHAARLLGIGARHQPTTIDEDAGDAAHARAADAYHVHPPQFGR